MTKLKLLCLSVCLGISLAASAQKRVTDNLFPTEEQQTATEEKKANEEFQSYGGVSFGYGFIDKGYLFSTEMMINGFFLEYGTGDQDFKDLGIKSSAWRIIAGYNYRYWLGNRLYIQALAGIGYGHSKTTYKGSDEEDSGGGGLISIRPAIGIRLWHTVSIEAGYRWDFGDFKFDKAHTLDYFNLGIQFGF